MNRDAAAEYRALAARHEQERDAARGTAARLSNGRLASFAVAVLFVLWIWFADGQPIVGSIGAGLAFVAFLVLVRLHARARASVRWHGRLHDVALLGEARVARDWPRLPERPVEDVLPSHPYATDVDAVGHVSLFTLLDTVSAFPGRPTLVRWLVDPSRSAAEVRERQAAGRELVELLELRQELHAHARAAGELRGASFEQFLEWAESAPWLLTGRERLAYGLAILLPAATLVSFGLGVASVAPGAIVFAPFTAGLVLLAMYRRRLTATIEAASARAIGLRQHAPMLALFEQRRFDAPLLSRLRQRISPSDGVSASASLASLDSAMGVADARHGGMGYAVLAAVLLWDFHAVAALERWQRRAGRHVRDWLRALGELEALAALATLSFDNPGWCVPEVREHGASSGDACIEATGLAHPLLPAEGRVANDVVVGPPGTILLVTGSNMSGKSTLLRAIGANVVLAQAGAPVCATAMRLPLVRIGTSIRVQDSLERGLSLFMAELERVRDIVQMAREKEARPFLYLLDEILHGTNTAERQIAGRRVLSHLTAAGAMGVVTTHDLALAATGELSSVTRHVHFEETFEEDVTGMRMTFDYRLRPGPATSANAVKLLRMVGL